MVLRICSILKALTMMRTRIIASVPMGSGLIMTIRSIILEVLLIRNIFLPLTSSSPTEGLIHGVEPVPSKLFQTHSFLATYVILSFNSALGAHHLDLRPPNPADPADVIQCRKTVLDTLKKWIAEKKLTQESKLLRTQ